MTTRIEHTVSFAPRVTNETTSAAPTRAPAGRAYQPRTPTRTRTRVDNPRGNAGLLRASITLAEADLQQAETADLATASNADLIVLIERLRGTLADLVRRVNDHTELLDARTRVAQRELDLAEAAELATASNADLVTLVERLRDTIADLVRLARATI